MLTSDKKCWWCFGMLCWFVVIKMLYDVVCLLVVDVVGGWLLRTMEKPWPEKLLRESLKVKITISLGRHANIHTQTHTHSRRLTLF